MDETNDRAERLKRAALALTESVKNSCLYLEAVVKTPCTNEDEFLGTAIAIADGLRAMRMALDRGTTFIEKIASEPERDGTQTPCETNG